MSEKMNELDEQNIDTTPDENVTPEEIDAASGKVSLEQNDNWTFEAEAPMLNDNLVGENFELEVAEEAPKPVEKPVQKPTQKPVTPPAKPVSNPKTSKNDKVMFVLIALISVVLAVLLGFLGYRYYNLPNTNEKMNPGNVALTVDGTDVSIGLYNYYYSMAFAEYTSGQYDVVPTKDFSTQMTTDADGNKISWEQMFKNSTISRIKTDIANYNLAVKDGLTLTEDQKKEIDEAISQLKETASSADKSIDEYLSENYGEYCGQATIKKLLTQYYLSQLYTQKLSVTENVTEDETKAYLAEHGDDYKKVTIAYLPITFDMGDEAAGKKALEQAKKYAKNIKTEDDMKLLIPKVWKDMITQYVQAGYYQSEEQCVLDIAENMEADITKNMEGFVDEALVWLFDENTKINDVSVFSDVEDGVVYIFMKVSDVGYDESEVYSVRHILIQPESKTASEDESQQATEFTDEEWAEAEKKAKDVLAEYNKGDKSEYLFATLAEKYSTDTGSTSAGMQSYGGLYSGVPLGQMVKEFEGWATDKSRKYGDVDIVKTEHGYHIMFFIKDTQQYLFECESAALTEKVSKQYEDINVKEHKHAMKNTKVAEPVVADDTAESTDNSEVSMDDIESAE